MAKQIKYRRGTTTQHAVFTGAQGELTVDTIRNMVIVHDGATPGGWPAANATAVASQISAITSNNAAQSSAIATLQSNAAIQANLITSLQSNAASQQASINAFLLTSNATLINQQFVAVNANVAAANVAIESLITANLIQAEDIDELRVSVTALNANVAAANVAIAGIVVGTGFATVGQLTANITAANLEIASLRANITAANLEIASLQANIGSDTGNFIFAGDDVSLPAGNVMTLSTYQVAGNKESKLTLSTSGISSLDVGNNLRIRIGNGTGFEKTWTFGADGSVTFPDASSLTGGNIMQSSFSMSNATHWTSSVTTIGDALNQLAARLYAIENP